MAVRHGKFGRGVVVEIEHMATDRKITVDFDGLGRKVLLAKFAKLTQA
jgi:DNA helicase-2/ATP-dependent DNA helicase PcrA